MSDADFDLELFLPYLLNKAAEVTSQAFQPAYRGAHGMTRAQWRVIANLAKFGALTAADICRKGLIEKTKVSRAVAALETRGLLRREVLGSDRRAELLRLTEDGRALFDHIAADAQAFDDQLRAKLGTADAAKLTALLLKLADPDAR